MEHEPTHAVPCRADWIDEREEGLRVIPPDELERRRFGRGEWGGAGLLGEETDGDKVPLKVIE